VTAARGVGTGARVPATPAGTIRPVAVLRMFASAREAAGTGTDHIAGTSVDEVLAAAVDRYGPRFEQILGTCKIWVNGSAATHDTAVGDHDEVAVLPPVSGGQ
jgi:sulfur-carrier protein